MKETISDKQGITILILFLLGSTLVVGTGSEGKKDMWLSFIIGLIISLPVVYIYGKLLCLYPGKDLYDILIEIFGKIFGKILGIIYVWFSLHLGAMVLFNFSSFINTVGLPETPRLVPDLCFIILCAFGVIKGIEVISRWAEFFFTISIIIIALIIILSTPNFRSSNILPILENGWTPVMKGAFSVFSFPLSETILFTTIFSSLQNKDSYLKVYFSGVIIGTLILTLVSVVNILVLGPYILSLNFFPTHVTVGRISLGNFLERLDIFVAVGFLVAGFVKICICLLAASKGFSKLFDLEDYRILVKPTALLLLNFSFFVFKDILEVQKFSSEVSLSYKLLLNGIIPIIILIVGAIKVHNKKIKVSNP